MLYSTHYFVTRNRYGIQCFAQEKVATLFIGKDNQNDKDMEIKKRTCGICAYRSIDHALYTGYTGYTMLRALNCTCFHGKTSIEKWSELH